MQRKVSLMEEKKKIFTCYDLPNYSIPPLWFFVSINVTLCSTLINFQHGNSFSFSDYAKESIELPSNGSFSLVAAVHFPPRKTC